MLTKNKKFAYAVILTFLVILFIATGERAALREMLVAQEIYYRGEYLITTYYPAPFGQYAELLVGGLNNTTPLTVKASSDQTNANPLIKLINSSGTVLSSFSSNHPDNT